MKYPFFISLMLCCSVVAVSQKPPIDSAAIRKWPSLESPGISDDGSYACYTIKNQPVGSNTVELQSTTTIWKKELIGARDDGFFTADNKKFIFTRNDTLYLFNLGSDNDTYISNIRSHKSPFHDKKEWLAYQLNDSSKELVLLNLITGKERRFASVTDYSFNNRGNILLIKTETKGKRTSTIALQWVNLLKENLITIWSTDSILPGSIAVGKHNFDSEGFQLAFLVKEEKSDHPTTYTIWYYKGGMNKAVMEANDLAPGIESGLSISNCNLKFSRNGRWIFFQLQEATLGDKRKINPALVSVDVWSYKDAVIQSEQSKELNLKTYDAAIDTQDGHVTRITHQDEQHNVKTREGDFVLIKDTKSDTKYWWGNNQYSYYLLFLRDGSRKFLVNGGSTIGYSFSFSPGGRYIVYFDQKLKQYFSYDVLADKARNISQGISGRLDNEYRLVGQETSPVGIAGWLENDAAILIYDNYDLWQVDPSGEIPPRNITNGYGSSHHIKFRLVDEAELEGKALQSEMPLLLTAFNTVNKDNGFYQKLLNKKGDPELLTMGPFFLYILNTQIPTGIPDLGTINPCKAKNSNTWVVERMTASHAPNYFLTKDFRTYTTLSDLQPQKAYNWLTTELVNWKQLDGTVSQGILYKPENFDPRKKYPIIFQYYEQLSFALNAYFQPEFTDASINIPWFVSHGYLVFTPDIHFSIASLSGRTNGENAYNAVVSAAQYLSRMPWVDASRMGINGHSFGGGETNHILVRTHLFAAAAEAAGASDAISSYLDVTDRQQGSETGQGRMGATLWQRPDLYLKNSPVLKADSVTTPILIMHNKADHAVPWGQGVEWYMALRRLGKKVWMLQYDDESHQLNEKAAEDYTIRITQFFDYYLKGMLPPKWMTEGIPARLKGIEIGYELDESGKKP